MKKGEDEVHPQRDCYVIERLIEDYFEEEKGKKRGETESHSLNETEEEGERKKPVRERGTKFLTETDCFI